MNVIWRGASVGNALPPLKNISQNDIEMYIVSIQLIMCVIVSRSLHVYFTTFDMILKYILITDIHVKLALL